MFLYVRLSYLIIDTTYGIGSIKSSTIKKTAQKQYKQRLQLQPIFNNIHSIGGIMVSELASRDAPVGSIQRLK
jgi:hypothetical protein